MRIGFLGAGKMAQALAKGFIKAGNYLKIYIISEMIV